MRLKSWEPIWFSSDPFALGGCFATCGAGGPAALADGAGRGGGGADCRNLADGCAPNSASCRSSDSTRAARAARSAAIRTPSSGCLRCSWSSSGPMAITLPPSCEGVVQEVYRLIVFVQEVTQMPVQVLVVDDDALSREVLALLLHGAGYPVETADSGDAALQHLQTAPLPPQVVLADLQMPGTTGNELALRLRGLCGPATTLLAMSASAPGDGSDREFDGFLLKPFTMETFTAAISGLTTKAAREPNGRIATVLDEAVYSRVAAAMHPPQVKQ